MNGEELGRNMTTEHNHKGGEACLGCQNFGYKEGRLATLSEVEKVIEGIYRDELPPQLLPIDQLQYERTVWNAALTTLQSAIQEMKSTKP